MTRHAIALPVPDASAFAKTLRQQLDARLQASPTAPSHLELLNLLARAAGFRNFQHLKAQAPLAAPPATQAAALADEAAAAAPRTAPADLSDTARRALGQFDAQGRLVRLPVKFSVQRMVMWALWLHLPARRVMSEREVNEVLKRWNTFGDHVTPRRELINMRLMTRKSDCSDYRKQPQRPDAEVATFLKAYRALLPRPGQPTRGAR